jgi:hypothetical protein
MTVLFLNLTLMALWVASTGVFSYANSALGFLVGFIVLWWLQPLVGPTAYFRKLPLAQTRATRPARLPRLHQPHERFPARSTQRQYSGHGELPRP